MSRKSKSSSRRDQRLTAGDRSVVVGGNVSDSTIITGDGNVVDSPMAFRAVYRAIDSHPSLPEEDRQDLKAEVRELEREVAKGDQADETFLARRLRNIKRIAPDILDVVIATMANPAAGFGMVAKKVADRMAAEANAAEGD
ncbi:MAG: hypothetical protein D6770_09455 [Anaerolineae bacterium]|nr:MAG: hypothetical protein D6770_09455 [Anaerolineae bacterium]